MMHTSLPNHTVYTVNATLWRSLQTLNVSRLLIALVLLAFFSVRLPQDSWFTNTSILPFCATIYVIGAGFFIFIKRAYQRRFLLQLVAQISFDLLFIAVFYLGTGGSKSGIAILFLFPLAGVGILASMSLALFFVAMVALFLLLVSAYQILQNDESNLISQSGFYGATFFAVVYVVNRMAQNLLRQEELAKERGSALFLQQAINRTVIADMGDGILVVDKLGDVLEFNPAAGRMLGLTVLTANRGRRARLTQIPQLLPIAQAMNNWLDGTKPNTTSWLRNEGASFVIIRHHLDHQAHSYTDDVSNYELPEHERPDASVHLKLRFVSIDENDFENGVTAITPCTLIFMQDVSDIENQAQQLKLASMGRLTASIAHEVRNPLASISYAASLLSEDVHNEMQSKRLLKIVEDNVTRLNQLIEDILKLSRKAQTNLKPFLLNDELRNIAHEFLETRGLAMDVIQVTDAGGFFVLFDLGHLHEVMTNLLSNAARYASGRPGCIRLTIKIANGTRRELHIQDDGPGISAKVRSHLFEPFYTTSSKGTGLGLYMARELCLNNHAVLDYEYRNDDTITHGIEPGGRFVIVFSSSE